LEIAEDGRLLDVRPPRAGDGPALPGLVVPGLIDAHTHLELDLAPPAPGGAGFVAWAAGLMGAPRPDDPGPSAARRAVAHGTAWLGDVSNGGHTAPWLEEAGLAGVVHHEQLGFDRAIVAARLAALPAAQRRPSGVWVQPSAHALFSTAPELWRAALRPDPSAIDAPRRAVHLAESEDEDAFLRDQTGPHADLLDRLGRDWRWSPPARATAVGALLDAGVLGPHLLLVHGVHLSAADLAILAAHGVAVALCPRSNLHIGGRLPDVPALLAAGIPLALGTDGSPSSPDRDVLAEAAALAQRWPDLPAATWLDVATHRGADAVGAPHHGRLRPGTRPGVLWLDLESPDDLRRGAPARRWLVPPAST
jgi:cytosine/adenosine deaminase-related metal-dependent hydrolase